MKNVKRRKILNHVFLRMSSIKSEKMFAIINKLSVSFLSCLFSKRETRDVHVHGLARFEMSAADSSRE
jgi:hypothetical protein